MSCLKKASDLGSFDAHQDLADLDMRRQNCKVAMAHHKVLAAAGYGQAGRDSCQQLLSGYKEGCVTKDDLDASLRAFQLARKEFASRERIRYSLQYSLQASLLEGKLFLRTNSCRR